MARGAPRLRDGAKGLRSLILRRGPCCSCCSCRPWPPRRPRPRSRPAACSRTGAPTARTASSSRPSTTSRPSCPASRTRRPWTTRCSEIGRYYLEVEHDAAKAREAFEQVTKRFPRATARPGPTTTSGCLTMERPPPPPTSTTPWPSSRACSASTRAASGSRARSTRPASPTARPAAWPRRSEAARRVALEHPTSDAAPAAQFELGARPRAHGRVPRQAMEEFQQVRNRYPGERVGAARPRPHHRALPPLRRGASPAFSAGRGLRRGRRGRSSRTCAAILMTPGRARSWIASDKVKSAVPVRARRQDGARPGRRGPAEPRRLAPTASSW